jgi:hybrid polyketide synthase / nonribosomal peptide synthetase FtdB
LTATGKLNFKELPDPVIQLEGEMVEPTTIYEQTLSDIWKKMLGLRQLSVTHNFFDLGGSSLHLIELMLRIQDHFKIEITVNLLLRSLNLKQMARSIEDIVTGKKSGAAPNIIYNPGCDSTIHSFPPAGGYSMVYESLAANLKNIEFISYNYFMGREKLKNYADLIKQAQPKGPYILFGYSMGGNLAFEVGKELEARGEKVDHIIIMDAYRITNGYKPAESDLLHFEKELKRHFEVHTGSDRVQQHTLKQARDYIEWCYKQGNHGKVNAKVHFIVEKSKENGSPDERKISWKGSSKSGDLLYYGKARHEEMLSVEYAPDHAQIIAQIV